MKLIFFQLFCSVIFTSSISTPLFPYFENYLDPSLNENKRDLDIVSFKVNAERIQEKEKRRTGCYIISGENHGTVCVADSLTMKCKASCYRGYEFPNGEREMTITCNKRTGVYFPTDGFPDCYSKIQQCCPNS